MLRDNILLNFLFISGALAMCDKTPHLNITAPDEMEALSGSCLQIPCNYSSAVEIDFDAALFGVWIKSDPRFRKSRQNVIFNSSGTPNTYPMTLNGNLSQKNCSTLFSKLINTYTDVYYFRIDGSFQATASCSSIQVTVHDSISPKIDIPDDLKEKMTVTITCSAPAPCPHARPTLTWNLQANAQNKLEQNRDGTFTIKIQQSITLSERHDGNNVSCSATYPVDGGGTKTAETKATLSVSYAPKDTSASVSPSDTVSAGSLVTLSCSSRAKPPITHVTWYRRSKGGVSTTSQNEVYTLNVTEEGVYFCVADNGLGQQMSAEIRLPLRGSTKWEVLVGVITVTIVLICMVIFALWRFRSTRSTSQQIQHSQNTEVERPTAKDVHYAEIDFSKQRRRASAGAECGPQQCVEYAEVKVCRPANTSVLAPAEALYSEVRRK